MGTQDFRFGEARHLKEQERARERLQAEVDAKKTMEARREFGQFSTPFALADEIASQAARLCGKEPVSFLEPCLGTGAFYSAVRKHFPQLS